MIEAIAIGVLVSILVAEFLDLSPSGFVVPGFLAYYLDQPIPLALLILATGLTAAGERLITRMVLLYGRRLLAIDLLLSINFVFILDYLISMVGYPLPLYSDSISYFMPALIVFSLGTGGFRHGLLSLAFTTLLVRLLLLALTLFSVSS